MVNRSKCRVQSAECSLKSQIPGVLDSKQAVENIGQRTDEKCSARRTYKLKSPLISRPFESFQAVPARSKNYTTS